VCASQILAIDCTPVVLCRYQPVFLRFVGCSIAMAISIDRSQSVGVAGNTGLSIHSLSHVCDSNLHWAPDAFLYFDRSRCRCRAVHLDGPVGFFDGGGDGALLCLPLLRSAVAADSLSSVLLALIVVEAS
jgi:hypothetical protein